MKLSQNTQTRLDHLFMNGWEVIENLTLNHKMFASAGVQSLITWLNYTYTW